MGEQAWEERAIGGQLYLVGYDEQPASFPELLRENP